MRPGYASVERMPTDHGKPAPTSEPDDGGAQTRRTAAAARALAEAAVRRARQAGGAAAAPKEIDGRGGADPTRYGDWEVNGLASDF